MKNAGQWVEEVAALLEQAELHYGHGTDNPFDEAAWLVLYVLGVPLDGSFDDWDREVSEEQAHSIRSLLAQRAGDRVPLAYLLGSAWFAGLEFEVNRDVLIPRSPIAEIIRDQFSPWMAPDCIHDVLDLCTGCGCIGIAVAVHLPWTCVDASDISERALAVAQRNAERHGVTSRVTLIRSDLLAELGGRRYDLIVANPPYVPAEAVLQLPAEYRAEPESALASGRDGLDACLQIMVQSVGHLRDNGVLICEVGESAGRLAGCLPRVPFLWLAFNHGGSGVFLLSRTDAAAARDAVRALIRKRAG